MIRVFQPAGKNAEAVIWSQQDMAYVLEEIAEGKAKP
jgi:hypothetical protein